MQAETSRGEVAPHGPMVPAASGGSHSGVALSTAGVEVLFSLAPVGVDDGLHGNDPALVPDERTDP